MRVMLNTAMRVMLNTAMRVMERRAHRTRDGTLSETFLKMSRIWSVLWYRSQGTGPSPAAGSARAPPHAHRHPTASSSRRQLLGPIPSAHGYLAAPTVQFTCVSEAQCARHTADTHWKVCTVLLRPGHPSTAQIIEQCHP